MLFACITDVKGLVRESSSPRIRLSSELFKFYILLSGTFGYFLCIIHCLHAIMIHTYLVHCIFCKLFWCAVFINVASTLRIRFIIHVHYTVNSYSVWCVLLVSVRNPHWRLGGWHSKLISCYLLLHVLQCFELTLFCYCLGYMSICYVQYSCCGVFFSQCFKFL